MRLVSARTTWACWARWQQWLAGGHERFAAGLEQRRSAVEVFEQFVREGLAGGQVADEAMRRGREGVPRREAFELGCGATQALDLVDVYRLQKRLAVGEVAVEGPDPHFGSSRDLLQ